jgi:CHAT domain-containing protein/tetratricopeptide (TPR) repeat protein
VTLVLAFVVAWLLTQAPAAPARPLSAHVPVRATLAGGERTLYTFDVPANYAARISVEQDGIDVVLRLAKHGQPMPGSYLDLTAGIESVERWYPPVMGEATRWDLRVAASLPRAARAEYVISVDIVPADASDRAIAAARQILYEAQEALSVPDGNGLRKGQERFAAARQAALAGGDRSLAAEATFQLGRMHDQLGDQPGSIELQLEALEMFRGLEQKDRQARVLNRLGDLSRKVGAVGNAERYFEEALPLAHAVTDPASVADILNNSALLMLAMGRAEEAITQFEGALPLARSVDSANVEGSLLNNLSESYRRLGMFDKAVELAEQSMPVFDRLNIPRRTARAWFLLGGAYFENGEFAKAESALSKSLEIFVRSGDQAQYAASLAYYARTLHAVGETDRAIAAFSEAAPLVRRSQNPLAESSMLSTWAEIDIDRADYEAALGKLDAAIRLARQVGNPYTEARSQYLRAVALQRQDRIADAVAAIQFVIGSVEAMRGSIARSDLRTSYLAAVRSYYDLYIDLLQQRGEAAAAFEVSERARARTLLEGLAESAAKIEKGVDPALLARERAVQRELNARETYRAQVVSRDGEQSAAAKTVAADVERLLGQWTAIRAQIRAASPAYAALQQPQPISVKQLQESLLDAGSTMVAYHLGQSRSYVWVIDRRSVSVQQLPPMAEIDAVARKYHDALSRELDALGAAERDRVAAAAGAAGRKLAAMVWKPIESKIAGRRVLIVADRALHYVPFAALPTSAGTPLLVSHEVVYLPSASVLATLRSDSRPVSLSASTAVFADPVFSKNDSRFAAARDVTAPAQSRASDGGVYGRLRFSRREAEAIGERAPGAFQALDFAASKSELIAKDLRRYRILHFATHGSLNTEHPELSGLVFSLVERSGKPVDGFLRLHEIYNLDLDADLVVLSACRTALGREVHGEGLIGLTRGFMYAGASRVVSSVWNVDDRASSLLMSRFYDAMRARKLAPAAALRDAQLSLMRDARWSNPHYWAAFGLQGEWK